ncbi:MAG TPA: hypothetical protein VK176_04225, partial [Phycisphaerales bacterium]|nr:hypothetical protein [Phycisphaerales bacterium]
ANNGVVVGEDLTQFFHWSVSGGYVGVGGMPAYAGGAGIARISHDGTRFSGTVAGPSGFNEAGVYDIGASSWTALGGIGGTSDASMSSGWGISGDGNSIVGLGWANAGTAYAVQSFNNGTFQSFGTSVPNRSTRANATNYDGSVVVGWQDAEDGFRQGAVWVNGVQTLLTNGASDMVMSEASDVDNAGKWVVGQGGFATGDQAWRWSAETGVQLLGTMNTPGWFVSGAATAVADTGAIVGYERGFGQPTMGEGFIWTESMGMVNLNDYLDSLGIAYQSDFVFSLPLGISDDGNTIVGVGRTDTQLMVGFVVTIPAPATVPFAAVGLMAFARRRR